LGLLGERIRTHKSTLVGFLSRSKNKDSLLLSSVLGGDLVDGGLAVVLTLEGETDSEDGEGAAVVSWREREQTKCQLIDKARER